MPGERPVALRGIAGRGYQQGMSDDRHSPLQRFVWRLEAFAYDVVVGLVRLMPLDVASNLGGWVGRTLGPMTGTHRTASDNLRIAFPEMPEPERQRLLNAQWDNTMRTFFELLMMDRLTPASGRLEIVGQEKLEEIARTGEPVIFISGHFANWELMPAAILAAGITCQITYRPTNNPYVDARIKKSRARYGVELFAPKGDGTRELVAALGRGECVALMNDQKYNPGPAVPFFGEPAHTAPGATRLALRFGARVVPMSAQRLPGVRFRLVVHDAIPIPDTGDKTGDIDRGVAAISRFIEARVREHPDDWFWVHKRWPHEAYGRLKER